MTQHPAGPRTYRQRLAHTARGAAIFTYLVVGGLIASASLAYVMDGAKTRTMDRGDAIIAQEAALLREYAEAVAARAIQISAAIDTNYQAALNTATTQAQINAAETARQTAISTQIWLDPASLRTAGVLRSNFPDSLPSGTMGLSAIIAPRLSSSGTPLPVQDVWLWSNGTFNSKKLYGGKGNVERIAGARLRLLEALRRDPPNLEGTFTDDYKIGLIRPGSSTIGIDSDQSIDLSRFGYLAPSSSPDPDVDVGPQIGFYIGSPGQHGYWVISLTSRVETQPEDCRASPAGGGLGAPIYRCSPGQSVADTANPATFCGWEEAFCHAQDNNMPGFYETCRAAYAAQGISMPAVRTGVCQASPYCSYETAEWVANNVPSACYAMTPIQCTDGAARRITMTQVENAIGNLGFSYTCPEGGAVTSASSLAGGPRRWSTTQTQAPVTLLCIPQYRHGVQTWLRPPAADVISQNYPAIGSIVPTSVTYDAAGTFLGIERFQTVTGNGVVPSGGRGLEANWGSIQDAYGPIAFGSIYPRDEVNFCVGPVLERAAPGTGPTQNNLPIPNLATAHHMVIPSKERDGNFLIYAFGSSFITDRPSPADPRSVRTFSDWTRPGQTTPSDSFQAGIGAGGVSRSTTSQVFTPTMRMNGYSEQGVAYATGSTAAPIEIRVPYNPPVPITAPHIPLGCGPYSGSQLIDIYGVIRPREYRDPDAHTGCPPAGPPWRVRLIP